MFVAVGLFLSLVLSSDTSARLISKDNRLQIEVTRQGKKSYIKNASDFRSSVIPTEKHEGAKLLVEFHGHKFKGDRYRVVNQDTGELGQAFDRQVNGCGGGVVAGDKMVWIYYDADGDTMSEPLSHTYAFIMNEKDGIPVNERRIDLPGIRGNWSVDAVRYGDWLMLFSNPAGERSLGILNLKTFEFRLIVKVKPNYPTAEKPKKDGIPDSGSFAICPNGTIYSSIGDMLSVWNWTSMKWKPVRKLKNEHWTTGYNLGHDDLLVGFGAMSLAHRGRVFALPQSIGGFLYISATTGIGVVYNSSFPFADGILLNPKNLSVICKIKRRKVTNAR